MQANNKLRDALEAALRFIGDLEIEPYSPLDEDASELRQTIMDALALPPRQCDIGTPYEQANRMRQFCAKQKRNGITNCGYCPIKHQYQRDCTLAWAQMPYAEEGGAK